MPLRFWIYLGIWVALVIIITTVFSLLTKRGNDLMDYAINHREEDLYE